MYKNVISLILKAWEVCTSFMIADCKAFMIYSL